MKSSKEKMEDTGSLFDTCTTKFAYLISEFNFWIVRRDQKKDPLYLVYQNQTTAVSIMHDRWENQIFVNLYQLDEGKLVQNPIFIQSNTKLYGYDLGDVLLVRVPGYYKKGISSGNCDLVLCIEYYSKMLRQYASDILQGDFTLFPKLEKIVKNRII